MDTDFRGFATGPAESAEALRSHLVDLSPAPAVSLHQLAPESVWCVLELERHAYEVAKRLSEPAYVFEVELANAVDGGEAHSGLIVGRRVHDDGEREEVTRDEIWQSGLVRGGVLPEVALDYLFEHIRDELLGPEPEPDEESEDGRDPAEALARHLVNELVESGQLELVNAHGRRTLVGPLATMLDSDKPIDELAEAIGNMLLDATEVVELHASDEELAELLAGCFE